MCNERCRTFDTIKTSCPYRTYQSILGEVKESGMILWVYLLSSFCITYPLYYFTFAIFQCCNLILLQHHTELKPLKNTVNHHCMLQVGTCMYVGIVSIKKHPASIRDVVLSLCALVTSKDIFLCRNKYYKIRNKQKSLDQSILNHNKDISDRSKVNIQGLL